MFTRVGTGAQYRRVSTDDGESWGETDQIVDYAERI